MKTNIKIALISLTLGVVAFAATPSENWDNNCASCHGSDGKGQTKTGKKLKLKDYTDASVQAKLSDAELLTAIADGVKIDGKEKMKPYKDELSPEEVKDLVTYVRQFKP